MKTFSNSSHLHVSEFKIHFFICHNLKYNDILYQVIHIYTHAYAVHTGVHSMSVLQQSSLQQTFTEIINTIILTNTWQ